MSNKTENGIPYDSKKWKFAWLFPVFIRSENKWIFWARYTRYYCYYFNSKELGTLRTVWTEMGWK